MAERIRLFIEKSWIPYNDIIIKVTISAGVTLVKESDVLDELIARADSLMYKSKSAGRNIVTAG